MTDLANSLRTHDLQQIETGSGMPGSEPLSASASKAEKPIRTYIRSAFYGMQVGTLSLFWAMRPRPSRGPKTTKRGPDPDRAGVRRPPSGVPTPTEPGFEDHQAGFRPRPSRGSKTTKRGSDPDQAGVPGECGRLRPPRPAVPRPDAPGLEPQERFPLPEDARGFGWVAPGRGKRYRRRSVVSIHTDVAPRPDDTPHATPGLSS
jgi:hypothetical protein